MCKTIKHVSIGTIITVLLFFMGSGMGWSDNAEVKIGVLAKRGKERCLKKWSPTAKYLTARIPGKTFVIVPLDSKQIYSAVEKGKIDFVLANPSIYVEIEHRFEASRIATLKNLRLGNACTVYGGVVFCRADRGDIRCLTDLKGKTFMIVDDLALAGWRAVWRELKEKGIDPYRDFKKLMFGHIHDAVVYAVRDGAADVGAVRTDTLERMQSEGKIALKDFNVIHDHGGGQAHLPFLHSTREYPEWPMAKVKHASDALAKRVAVALFEMPADSQAAEAARCAGWTIPLNYQPVHDCLKILKLGPYKELGKITHADVIRKYRFQILFVTVLIIFIVGSVGVFFNLNRKLKSSHKRLQLEIDERKQTLKTLKESEREYRLLSDNTLDCIWQMNLDLEFTYINPSIFDTLGFTQEEWIGSSLGDHCSPEVMREIMAMIARKLENIESNTGVLFETYMDHKNGEKVAIEITAKILVDEDRNPIGFQGTARDISDRKLAEKSLDFERKQLLSIFNSINQAIYIVDPKTYKILYVNDAMKTVFKKNLVGGICYKEFQGFESPCKFCTNEIILKEKNKPYLWEHHNPILDKDYMVVDRIIRWPDGRDVRFEIAIDITEHKRSKEKLRKNEENYRLLFTNANDAIFVVQDELIKFSNPRAEDMTGFSAEELTDILFTKLIHPEDNDMVLDRYERSLKGEDVPSTYSFRIINKSCNTLWVQLNTALITWNKRPATINFLRDITLQKKLEDQLRQAQKIKSIGTLAGGIAHDFNNILFAIMGFTEILLEDALQGSRNRENLNEILKAAKRARDLIRQILTFSRQGSSDLKPLKIQTIVKEAFEFLRSTIPTSIKFSLKIDDDCGAVMGNSTQLHQIVINLCTNAYHAVQEADSNIEVSLAKIEFGIEDVLNNIGMKPGRYIRLTVSDTGHGMERDVVEQIFDPYYTTKEKGKGTGLGLSVVHGIVKEHGGEIKVYSEPGKGSTFLVFLPVIETSAETSRTEAIAPVQKGNERILLVDDEEQIVKMQNEMLKLLGYHVTPRTSSIETLEAFRAQPDKFDLVITDMTMPNMSGAELASELVEIRPDIPIIICTGFSEKMSKERADVLGIKGFLTKPIVRDQIARTIRKVLDE